MPRLFLPQKCVELYLHSPYIFTERCFFTFSNRGHERQRQPGHFPQVSTRIKNAWSLPPPLHGDTRLVCAAANGARRGALQNGWAVRTAVTRCRHLPLWRAFQNWTRLPAAYRRGVEARALGAVVQPKRLASHMHLRAQQTTPFRRFEQIPAADTMFAALAGHA
jgi:hypothetical protein